MNKIKAYTVIEMLVVMMISAVSIGITYTTYRIFAHQYVTYKHNSENIAQYVLLDKLLSIDFLKADKVLKTDDGILIQIKLKEVKYEFNDNHVIRIDQALTDTFNVQATDETYWWNNQEEHIPGQLIDQLNFNCTYKEEKLEYSVSKQYGADAWMYLESIKNN